MLSDKGCLLDDRKHHIGAGRVFEHNAIAVARALFLLLILMASCSSETVDAPAVNTGEPIRTAASTADRVVELQLTPQLASYSPGDSVALVLVVDVSINLKTEVLKGFDSFLERWDEDSWERVYVLTGAFEGREAASWPIDEPNRVIPDLAWAGDVPDVVVLPRVPPDRYRIVKEVILRLDGVQEPVFVSAPLEIREES